MTVKEFIEKLKKLSPDSDLFFTTSIWDCEVCFDKVTVEDYDEKFEESIISLELSARNKKDFIEDYIGEKLTILKAKMDILFEEELGDYNKY